MVQEGGRRYKKSTLNDLVHLTPLRIPLMNPPLVNYTVASPHQRDSDPDPIFTSGRIGLNFSFEADPDMDFALYESDATLPPLIRPSTVLQYLQGSILSLLQLLNFDFYADPDLDPAVQTGMDPDPASQNDANPDPQSWLMTGSHIAATGISIQLNHGIFKL